MDAFRKGLFRIADDISLALQNAGKTFGFLADGRDLIEISESENGRVARFPDHSDEGWPKVEVRLPDHAQFQYAATAPLTRLACWTVATGESEVLEELSSHIGLPPFESRAQGGAVARLGSNATLTVMGASSGLTLLSLEQTREPEAIREVLQNRATR